MLGRHKPVEFDPYGRRQRRRGLPRWLLLLLIGTALGAGGVLFVQQKYMPPRLSAKESAEQLAAAARSEAEARRLQAALTTTTEQLKTAQAEQQSLQAGLAKSQKTTEQLHADMASLLDTLPPDPRGGPVALRAGRFSVENRQLVYDLVLSRERGGNTPFNGVMQLVVSGTAAAGGARSLPLAPVPVSMARYQSLRGELPLPEGFKPDQVTVRVLDRPGGQAQGMRVWYVR